MMNTQLMVKIEENILGTWSRGLNTGKEHDVHEHKESNDNQYEENQKKQEDYSFQGITSLSSF